MAACKNPIKIGATLSVDIQRTSNGEPVDITDLTVESFIKHPKFGTYEMDVEIVNEELGQIKLVLSSDVTAELIPGDYIWDIAFTDDEGMVEVFPKDNEQVILTFIKGATK